VLRCVLGVLRCVQYLQCHAVDAILIAWHEAPKGTLLPLLDLGEDGLIAPLHGPSPGW
jgi:hypothetical protein